MVGSALVGAVEICDAELEQKQTTLARIALAALPIVVIATMLAFGWRKWPDILVDFGGNCISLAG